MPSFDIIKTSQPQISFRVASVLGTFDLQNNVVTEHFEGNIDLPSQWSIGLIVGASGTGKTTIAKELFPDAYINGFEYSHESILDDMPQYCSVTQITSALTSVGLSSVTTWLKSYNMLSNGEKMRCDLARALLDNAQLFVFDEYTSVVDRNIAEVSSYAVQKAIRKHGGEKQFIAVSCHYDIEDWLLPDWVFDTNSMTFRNCEKQKKNRPNIELRIYKTNEKEYYWRIFRKYHYLSSNFNKAAVTFIVTCDDNLCAFFSALSFPHPHKKNTYRVHRFVILPDYQGLSISKTLLEFFGNYFYNIGKLLIITTSHPRMIQSLNNSCFWKCTRFGRVKTGSTGKFHNITIRDTSSHNRITASFEYKPML